MTESKPAMPVIIPAPAGFRTIEREGVRWVVREDVADFLDHAGALDVWELGGRRDALVIKEGPHRIVYRIRLQREGEPLDLFVKIFLLPRARDLFKYVFRSSRGWKEWRVAERLERIGIPTAKRVAVGERRTGRFLREDVIITEALDDVVPLDRFVLEEMPRMKPSERTWLIRMGTPVLAAFVRTLHDRGVLHRDFHGGNILVHTRPDGRREFVLLDLHQVLLRDVLTLGARTQNLRVFNRFFSLNASRTSRLRFWNRYVEGVPYLERFRRQYARLLEEQTVVSRERLWRSREKRCLRTNKDFRVVKVGGWRIYTARGRWELPRKAVNSIPSGGVVLPDATVMKDSTTTMLWEQALDFGGQSHRIVVKRYNRRPDLELVKSFLRPSRALRNWRMANALRLRGLPAVEVLAAFERRELGCVVESWLVMRKVEGAENLYDYAEREFAEPTPAQCALRRRMTRELAKMISLLHERSFTQRDLKPANVLVRVEGEGEARIEFALIDFDGMKRRRRVTDARRARDLSRLAAQFVGSRAVRLVDRMRFLDEYFRRSGLPRETRREFIARIDRLVRKKLEAWKSKKSSS